MKIDISKFIFIYEVNEFKPLDDSQHEGLRELLGYIAADEHITDYRWAAYMLATVLHECSRTWRPIHEHGSRQYFIGRYGSQTKVGKVLGNDTPEEGAIYAGKGFTQTTGENNSEMLEKVLPREYPDVIARWEAKNGRKFDLTVGDQPGDANDNMALLDPEIAYINMSVCMRKGLYTGVGLPKYINGEKCDYVNSRKIINWLDCAETIAEYAVKIERIFKRCQEVD